VISDLVPDPCFSGSNILVVEDDADTAALLQIILEDADASVIVATTACDATRVLSAALPVAGHECSAATRIDLIMLDLRLSDADGADIMMQLRHAGYNLPPVIVISAAAYYAVDEAAGRIGALGVVYKPFGLCTLLACVEDALRCRS
jgi:DNA-binding response OmpR family regulator